MLVELNQENFEQETKQGLKLVEFYTPGVHIAETSVLNQKN